MDGMVHAKSHLLDTNVPPIRASYTVVFRRGGLRMHAAPALYFLPTQRKANETIV